MAEVVKGIVDIEINTGNAAAELKILQQQINSVFLSLNKNNTASLAASQKYSASLADMVNSSKVFTAETVRMRTAAGALDDTLKKGQATLGQYFSAKYVRNGALFAETLDLARQKASVLQTQFIATGKSSKGLQDALAIRPLQAFADQATIASQRTQILSSMFRQGTTQLVNFGKNVQWAGRQLMVGFTVPLTIFGTTAGKVFSDLEKQTVAFKKVYGDLFTTPKELQSNLKAVQDLGREYTKYGIAVKDTMSLAAQAAAAGRRNSDLTDAVSQATRLATLGQMDQNAALETTIALQSAFKLSGADLADTINYLNMVENQTVVSLQDIAAAIPRVAPVIEGLGGSVKDLTVFLAAMQEGGVSAEQGANALKSGLGSLINPSKSATEALGKFGINLDAIIQTNQGDLMKTVTGFANALSTLGEFQQQQALEDVFGKYQYARLGALFENLIRDGSQARQVMDTMGYSVEELAMTADRELKTIEQAFSVQLKAAVEKFKLAIAPIGEIFVKLAIPLVNFATSIADAFNSLPDFSKKFIAFAAIITGLVIPAGTMFFGLLMNLTGTLAKLFQFMGAFGKGFLQGGIVGAFKNATQSTKYFSTAEIEAALAAQQLGTATEFTNSALRKQVTEAMGAAGAVKYLGDSYTILITKMMEAAKLAPYTMGVGQSAAGLAKTGMSATGRVIRPPQMRNSGGRIFMSDGSTVPGTGNADTVPAMLTPGEFVVNKNATRQNLGLLYAINGGGAGYNKGGVTYASRGAYLGPREALAASTAEIAAFTSNRRASATKATVAGASSKEGIQGLLNNLVYLINPNSNKQLIGNRIMGGFDKRGVPLDQLKKEMTSDIGMWMIDAYAGQKWAKTAYKTTLSNNFDSIAAKYPGKEIRFLDSKGLERIQDVIDRPEYDNVKFVSVKDLHNDALYNRLSPDHLQRLLSDDTANVITQRMRSSTGKIGPRSGYQDLNSNSYTKMQKSWRGDKRPLGFEGAHMYNMGGKVPGMQYFAKNKPNRLVEPMKLVNIKQLFPQMQQVTRGSMLSKQQIQANRDMLTGLTPTKSGKPGRSYLEEVNKFLSKEFDEIFDGMLINDTIALISKRKTLPDGSKVKAVSDKLIISALSKYDPNDPSRRDGVAQILKERGIIKGNLNYRQVMTKDEAKALQKEAIEFLTGNNSEDKKFISKTSKALITRDSSGKIIAQKGHHTPFPEHRENSTVNEHYFGQAALDTSNQLHNVLKQKGLITGETASTAAELAFQQKQLREQLGLGENEFLHYNQPVLRNKGGIIPSFGMGGLRGKAIFERGKAGVPKIMNLSGLAKNGEDVVIDLVRGGMNVDDAIKFAKLTQTGQLRTGIPTGPVRDIEDYIKRKIDFEKSQGSMTSELYRKYYGIRNKPISEQQKTIDNYNKLYWGDSGPGMYNKGGVAKYNRGNIVPGQGNTDTVPAMLTPGEFVVNKEATRNNMNLLHSINNGSMSGYNMGGKVTGMQYFATKEKQRVVQGQASKGLKINPMAQMGLMSAGFMLPMIGQQMQQSTNQLSKGIGDFIGFLTPAAMIMSILPSKMGMMIAGIALAGTAIYKVIQKFKEIQKSGSTFIKAMYGSADATKAFAETFGRQSNASRLAQQQAGLISPEATQAASQFIGTDAGKKLIEDVRTATRLGGEAVDSLRNQLMRQVISGIITQEEAKGIATEVGVALGNQQIGIDVSAQITKILGVNGSDILKDPQGIIATMTPKIDEQAIKKQAEFLYKEQTKGFMGGVTKLFDIESMQQYKIQQGLIAESAVQSAAIEREARASIDLALQQNRISVEKYLAVVNSMSANSTAGQITENFFKREDVNKATKNLENAQKNAGNFDQNRAGQTAAQNAISNATKDYNNIVAPFAKQMEAGVTEAFKNAGIEYLNEDFKKSINKIASGDKGIAGQLNSLVLTGGMSLNMAGTISGFTDDQVANLQANAKKAGLSVDNYIRKIGLLSDANLQAAVLEIAVKANQNGTPIDLDKLGKNLATLLTLPAELRTALDINIADPADVMDYGPKAKEIKKQYDDINKYVKDKNKDLSSKPVQQEIITKFAGENAGFVKQMIGMLGKDFDPIQIPLMITMFSDPKIQETLKYLSVAGYRGGTTFNDPSVSIPAYIKSLGIGSSATSQTPPVIPGAGEKSPLQQMKEEIEQAKKYQTAVAQLQKSKASPEAINSMSEELAIQIAGISNEKKRIALIKDFENLLKRRRDILASTMTAEEKQLQIVDFQDKLYSRQLTLIDRRINSKQQEINKEQDLNEVRQHGLDKISEQEEKINEAYDKRVEALDKVDNANQRNASRQKSRISLATALTSGDIGAAAQAAAEITSQEALYKIEDARKALEVQRENAIKAIKITVNGVLMTRKEIEDAIKASNERIYQIGLDIKKIEEEKIPILRLQEQLADSRYQLELKTLAATTSILDLYKQIATVLSGMGASVPGFGSGGTPQTPGSGTGSEPPMAQQDKYVKRAEQITKAINGQLNGSKKSAALSDFNRFINNSANKVLSEGERDLLISRYKLKVNPPLYAMGGKVNYRGSNEAPPALKMAYGSMVPGMGNTDRVPALLTPGEFVIRKSVASAYMPLLEQLNGNIYPGAAMPKGSAKNNSNLYNNSYSINVNVAGTDASPDEIANAVMSKIKQVESRSLRGVKVV